MDTGAQVIMSTYSRLLPLIHEMGLDHQLCALDSRMSFFSEGKHLEIDARNPLALLTAGILPPGELVRVGLALPDMLRRCEARSQSDLLAWEEFDVEDSETWIRRTIGTRAAERFIGPVLRGGFYQDASEVSATLAAWVFSAFLKGLHNYSLRDGLDQLHKAIAKWLDVRLGKSVSVLGWDPSRIQYCIQTPEEKFWADRVVLALPKPKGVLASELVNDSCGRALCAVPVTYRPGVTVGVEGPSALTHYAGYTLVDTREQMRSVTLGRASAKAGLSREVAQTRQRDLITNYLYDTDLKGLVSAPELEIEKLALGELERIYPEMRGKSSVLEITRWEAAMPTLPVGAVALIRRYREAVQLHRPGWVWASDAISVPCMDGAVESGEWAARQILA